MRFTSKNDLNRLAGVGNNAQQTVVIPEEQVSAFVRGKTAGKTDCESGWVKQDSAGNRLNRVDVGMFPLVAGTADHVVDQLAFEVQAHTPDIIIRDVFDFFPHGRIVKIILPVRPQIAGVEDAKTACKPSAGVNTIGDVGDWDILSRGIRPKILPHLAGNLAMELRDAVAIV